MGHGLYSSTLNGPWVMVFILALWMDLGALTLLLHSEWTWVNGLCSETENYLRVCLKTKDLAYPHQLPLRDSITAVIWNGISFVFIIVFIMLAAWRLIIQCCDPDCGRKIYFIHFIPVPKEKEPFLREREREGGGGGSGEGEREIEWLAFLAWCTICLCISTIWPYLWTLAQWLRVCF